MSPEAKQDYLVQFMADMILCRKPPRTEVRRHAGIQAPHGLNRNKLLMGRHSAIGRQEAMTEAAMRKVYDDARQAMGEEKEVHARHILFRAPAGDDKAARKPRQGQAVVARLKKGEDFAKVVGRLTEDSLRKANAATWAFLPRSRWCRNLRRRLRPVQGEGLRAGEGQFGCTSSRSKKSRVKPQPKFEDVKPQIEQYVVRKAQAELVTSLRASAKIER